MAVGSFIAVTPGSGAKLATGPTYTENANVVQDEKVILGEQYMATYTATAAAISLATGASHTFQLMAGASLNVYVERIELYQFGLATTANLIDVAVIRLSSAGTGGTTVTPVPLDSNDSASGATCMTLPTVKGTEGVIPHRATMYLDQTAGASSHWTQPVFVVDYGRLRTKQLRISAGTANGICFKDITGIAGATVSFTVWFRELPF